jgi:polysaccharide export outer membrane protein
MLINKNINIIILFLIIFILNSCASKKNLIYLQDSSNLNSEVKNYTPLLKKDDFLYISVLGADENTSKLINLPQNVNMGNKGYTLGNPSLYGYLIDENGEIEFPLIGKIKFVGLTRIEASELLKSKLENFIKNPIVQIQIQNFKITVLGEVKNPGTFTIPNERITLFEGIGLAGDLTINGKRKDVVVIREENGIRKEYRIDLTSKNIFDSPVYFLNQNDLVYISPNQAKINSSATSTSAGIFISIASLIITTINFISK